jgi:hypothetical protein
MTGISSNNSAKAGVPSFPTQRLKADRIREGEAAVSVPAIDKLPGVIDTLNKAVAAGELDQQLAAVGEVGRPVPSGGKAA